MYGAQDSSRNRAGLTASPLQHQFAKESPEAADLFDELASFLADSACVVAVGNRLRQDDGAGLFVAEGLLAAGLSKPANTIFAEDVPESFLVPVAAGPWRRVVVVDAIQADVPPGTILVGRANELLARWSSTSTHDASLRLCCEIWEKDGKQVFLLGIVPAGITLGAPLTNTVREAIDLLISGIAARRNGRIRHVG
ncbi:MAG: hypothetical protein Kow00109_06190 [Acidobacteriota bacterium]